MKTAEDDTKTTVALIKRDIEYIREKQDEMIDLINTKFATKEYVDGISKDIWAVLTPIKNVHGLISGAVVLALITAALGYIVTTKP